MPYVPVKKLALVRFRRELTALQPGERVTVPSEHVIFSVCHGARVPTVRNQLKAARPRDFNLFAVADHGDGDVLIYPSRIYEAAADLLERQK